MSETLSAGRASNLRSWSIQDIPHLDAGLVGARYRLRVAVPTQPPPASGYPLLVMLDGNALTQHLTAACAPAALQDQPLVLLVGYALEGDAAKEARVYDYTPALADQPEPADPRMPAWRNGGADALLAWLEEQVMPVVARCFDIDAHRRTLYGHSYGGLCVLRALCARTAMFDRYVAVSPSVWWQGQAILDQVDACIEAGGPGARVLVLAGEREAWHARATGPDGSPESRTHGQATLPAAQALAERLSKISGFDVAFEAVKDGTHHSMLALSVAPALVFAGGS